MIKKNPKWLIIRKFLCLSLHTEGERTCIMLTLPPQQCEKDQNNKQQVPNERSKEPKEAGVITPFKSEFLSFRNYCIAQTILLELTSNTNIAEICPCEIASTTL